MAAAIKHVSKILNFIKRSTKDTEALLAAVGLKLPKMNLTRWNSQLFMVSKVFEALEKDSDIQTKFRSFQENSPLTVQEVKM